MKTSFRILTMSLFALVAFTFSSKTFAVSMPFQKITWTNSEGKTTEVTVDENGHFTTPPMSAGKYTYSWSLISKPTGSNAQQFGVGRGISSPTGGSADREGSTPSVSEVVITKSTDRQASAPSVSEVVVSKVEVSYEIKAPRDVATGQASGIRMHKPFIITKELDKSSPLLYTKLGVVVVDMDTDGITGTVSFKTSNNVVVRGWDLAKGK